MPMFVSKHETSRHVHERDGTMAFMVSARQGGGKAEDINKIEEERKKSLELKSADRPAIKDDNIDA